MALESRSYRIRGTLGDIDPLKKVPFQRAICSRIKEAPQYYLGVTGAESRRLGQGIERLHMPEPESTAASGY